MNDLIWIELNDLRVDEDEIELVRWMIELEWLNRGDWLEWWYMSELL